MKPFWCPAEASGFLLDWDGVIADTKLDFSSLREKYFGGRRALLIEDACELSPDVREVYMQELEDIEMEGAKKAVAVEGAFEFIEWLKENKKPFCILSRNCMNVIRRGAETIGFELPQNTWGRDNFKFVKPDPKALTAAAEAIGSDPCRCVYVGDFIYDLQGARRAGMRAVLVQHTEMAWRPWYDAAYPKLTDFASAVKNNDELIPWEYREIFEQKGKDWLNRVCRYTLALPEDALPNADTWLASAAALGVGAVYIAPDRILTPDIWKKNPSFGIEYMGFAFADAARAFLAPRFPLIEVVTKCDNYLTAPSNADELMRYVESIVMLKV